jgi:hypothetical protein
MYIDILRHLRDAARRKRSKKMKGQQLVSPSRHSSSTPVGFGQEFLRKGQVLTLELPRTLLTWLQLIFTCSPDQNQRCRNGNFVMQMT